MPCRLEVPDGLMFGKWKYVSIYLYPIYVLEQPSQPEILHQADFLETEKLKMLGECVVRDSYPEGNVTWYKNGRVLQPVEEVVVINLRKVENRSTGLFTMTSSLQYMPTKEDANAKFTCIVTYYGPSGQKTVQSEPVVFDVHYPTEKVTIRVLSQSSTIKEGDNVTLKCSGNGNPPPQEFLFYIPVSPFLLSLCSEIFCIIPLSNTAITDSLTPSGEVTKQIGEALPVSCTISSSRNATVFWIKDNTRMKTSPSFSSLQYQDAGNYICETTLQEVEGLKKRKTLKLIVEGKPQIKMTKKTNTNKMSKTVVCHVEGFPKPAVQWTVTGSGSLINKTEETKYVNGKFSSKIIIAPEENVTLTCIAENQLERTVTSLNVSAISIPEYDEPEDRNDDNSEKVNDQAKLIVGIVVGLLLVALVAGVVYWLYVKKSKTASKHVDKDLGNIEENKKLEENNHKSET
uniref:Activated leukocyte cell adhesion molecule n=1 Tax=Pavo cristatus TaxID=9049 RepID=A0A8C9G0Z1_PAVCR